MSEKTKKQWIIVLIVCFGIALRLYKIDSPIADISAWRQVDTDSIAKNFLRFKFNILYPQLNYDGPPPNYAELEFQLVPYLIALLYKVWGINVIWARLVPVAFGAGSIYLMYLVARQQYDEVTGYLSAFVYAIIPLNIYFHRAVMPESAMLFFSLGTIYFFAKWLEQEKKSDYCWATVFFALALLIKLPTLILIMPLFFVSYRKLGFSMFKRRETYLFLILSIFPVAIYYWFVHRIAVHPFVSGIAREQVFASFFTSPFKRNNLLYLLETIWGRTLSGTGCLLFLVGLGLRKREKSEVLAYSWFGAVGIYLFFIVTRIHLEYYTLPLIPVASLFIGKFLAHLLQDKKAIIAVLLFLAILSTHSYEKVRYFYVVDQEILSRGMEVNLATPPGSLIIIDEVSPVLLHAADRMGWRFYPNQITPTLLEDLKSKGAHFYVPARERVTGELQEYLSDNYQVVPTASGLDIYDLR
jgi:hypothetical protein